MTDEYRWSPPPPVAVDSAETVARTACGGFSPLPGEGSMVQAVTADLTRLGDLTTGVRGSLAALAVRLARAMDAVGEDTPTPAQIAQLGQQLRTTLQALSSVGGSDGSLAQQLLQVLSTPVGDTTDPEPADDGAARRAGSRTPRKTPNAMAAARSKRRPRD